MSIVVRNMFDVEPFEFVTECSKDCKAVLDDTSAFEMLCPVSEVTGHRANPLDALNLMLNPEKARLVQEVLQEIPPSGVPSHDAMFDILEERCESGTDAERALFREKLMKYADTLYSIRPDLKPKSEDSIKFDNNDEETKES